LSDRKPLVIEISPGELLDRISILQLKARKIDDPEKRALVSLQLAALLRVCQSLGDISRSIRCGGNWNKRTRRSGMRRRRCGHASRPRTLAQVSSETPGGCIGATITGPR